MLFQLDSDDTRYVLHNPANGTECVLQFDPPVSQMLMPTSSGVYYTTVITSGNTITEQVIHYANDGTITSLPYIDVTALFGFFASSDGSRVAWSQTEITETGEGDQAYTSDLYSADADGSEIHLLYTKDSSNRTGMWTIHPLRFTNDGNLLFTIQPAGKGGRWDAYTGRYSNLYSVPVDGSNIALLYECSTDNRGDCIGDISADNAYFAVTDRNAGEVIVYTLAGSLTARYPGPGQEYVGHPNFNFSGDLVFMSADVKDDGSIKQGYISYAESPYKKTALPLFTGTVTYIWAWVDEGHILCSDDSKFIIDLQGNIQRLPEIYDRFLGVLP
ncbi:MAG: hypothetical protein JXA33_17775 [Anaerolineae bacterium]|nr:hypothetical protein [Anaerolineae bacterium]